MDQSSPRPVRRYPPAGRRAPPGSGGIWWTGSMTARAGQLVAAFVKDGSLSPQEREELRRLLDEMEV